MKLKWKSIYNEYKQRKYCEITGIKEEDIQLESNSFKVMKERKKIILISTVIMLLLIIWTFRKDIKVLLMVLAFFIIAGLCFFIFNYFKFVCMKDGLYVKFGFQQGKFTYDRIKSIYLSKFNDYTFLLPGKRIYSLVIRYTDNYNRLRELSFPNYFLKPEDIEKFLDNFTVTEEEDEKYVQFERFKILKKIGKVVLFILFASLILGIYFMKR